MPSGALLLVARSPEEMAARTARFLAAVLRSALAHRPEAAAALAGGRTPAPIYRSLAAEPLPWQRMLLFLGDERRVAPDDPRSNYRMIRSALGPTARVMPVIPPEAAGLPAADALCRRYAGQLGRAARTVRNGVPVLDLILLGLGEDGHTASLFPGSSALAERTAWMVPAPGPQAGSGASPGVDRLTLTLPVLVAADELVFIVRGAKKADALSRALEGDPSIPAGLLSRRRPRATWFVDPESAASLA
ncbi:MAG: 6-phosphogluconolactonase [Acidobacteriota bacterium]